MRDRRRSGRSSVRIANSSPSDPGEHVAVPDEGLDPSRDGEQQRVADGVPVGVVDGAEVVEVEIQHRRRPRAAPAARPQRALQAGLERAGGWRARSAASRSWGSRLRRSRSALLQVERRHRRDPLDHREQAALGAPLAGEVPLEDDRAHRPVADQHRGDDHPARARAGARRAPGRSPGRTGASPAGRLSTRPA